MPSVCAPYAPRLTLLTACGQATGVANPELSLLHSDSARCITRMSDEPETCAFLEHSDFASGGSRRGPDGGG